MSQSYDRMKKKTGQEMTTAAGKSSKSGKSLNGFGELVHSKKCTLKYWI